MSTYNENLHATVVDSLRDQELEQKKINSQLTASMFTLYYAEGARITAAEKLDKANQKLDDKTKVKVQAVYNSNHSTNLLLSANQGKAYIDQSVTNTAVSAANVQVASNAILRLSSDMGSIYSIVSAADFDEEIYEQSKGAYELMNTTAYDAERTSQRAMEASSLTAEVSMTTVANKAKSTNASIDDVLNIAETEFNATSQVVAQDNIKFAEASRKEKKAEGILEDVNVEFSATNAAYNKMNLELNLNLNVPAKYIKPNGFRVEFNAIKPVFKPFHSEKSDDSDFLVLKPPIGYPVKMYNVFIVKDKSKATFSISEAQNLLRKTKKFHQEINAATKTHENTITSHISIFNFDDPKLNFYDSDGDLVTQGQKYVVFVMAEYLEEYKKTINNFDDFLSAPSSVFTLTYKLKAIAESSIKCPDAKFMKDHIKDSEVISVLTFSKLKTKNFGMSVDYRCIFLPADEKLVDNLLTVYGLDRIEEESERIEEIANHFNPEIVKAESVYNAALSLYNKANDQMQRIDHKIHRTHVRLDEIDIAMIVHANNPTELEKLKKEHAAVLKDLDDEKKKKKEKLPDFSKKRSAKSKAHKKLKDLRNEKKKALAKIDGFKEKKKGLFFNLQIAEEVNAGNFTKAEATTFSNDSNKVEYQVLIKDDTTDNFGNPLVPGNLYVPVILSYSTVPEENLAEFTNAMSNYKKTKGKVVIKK